MVAATLALVGCKKESPPSAQPGPTNPAEAPPDTPPAPDQPAPPDEVSVEKNSDVELEWSLKRDGEVLRLSYRLTNKTGGDIFVADKLLAYHTGKIKLVPERVIVSAGSADGVVRFTRGLVEPETEEMNHPPGVETLAAGATRDGSAVIKLPLRGWHNYSTPPDMPDEPATAELEIAYLVGDSIAWGAIKTADGTEVRVPQMPSYLRFARTIRSQPRPLP